ncbi:related to pre-mrna splicing factor 18 [Ustilago sp. UG-2017b]|nr:related to pre-mrna splicing factor 18 [Ustilago sp. UG-2017b]
MDFLKAEIANKRKAAEVATSTASASTSKAAAAPPPNKYMRRGDLEKLREQQERSVSPSSSASPSASSRTATSSPSKRLKTEAEATARSACPSTSTSTRLSSATKAALDTAAAEVGRERFNVSNEEAVRRLRAKGEPIRLFGESDKERRLRLRALELIEEKGGGAVGQNDFRNALQSAESATALELLEKRNAANKGKFEQARLEGLRQDAAAAAAIGDAEKALADQPSTSDQKDGEQGETSKTREGVGMGQVLDLNLIKTDIDRVYPIIYYTLKGLLQEWADSLASRPDEVKHTMQGKLAAATQVQSADYLKPLFKKLRKRALTPDVLMRIAEIVHYMQKRQYRNANDSYLQLSIGNAPWPIGVTMVGIHERSGREKIFSSNVAHVLNDEVSRKYIQSLKRLMTFAQTKYPPEDISMMMG